MLKPENLENMIEKIETVNQEINDKMPWYAKFLYSGETMQMDNTIAKTKTHVKNYQPTEEWYMKQGELLNNAYKTTNSSIKKGYWIVDIVDSVVNAIGNLFNFEYDTKKKIEEKMGITKLPKKETTLFVLNKNYEAAMADLCFMAEVETGKDFNYYWGNLNKVNVETKYKPSGKFENLANDANNYIKNMNFTPG